MEDYIWLICFLPLFIIFWEQHQQKQREQQRRVLKLKMRRKGQADMNEVITRFIGKECIISTMNSTTIGTIDAVEGNWVILRAAKENATPELINIDYINRIQEYPRTKKGKRKIVW